MRLSAIIVILALSLLVANISPAQRGFIRAVGRRPPDLPETVYRTGRALLIGINDYPNLPAHCQLNYAVKDATEMAELLQTMFGFPEENITVLTNEKATEQGITDALASLADPDKVSEDDCVLVFFSGHGQTVSLPYGGEMGFLVPHEARVDLGVEPNYSQYYSDCIGMDELKRVAKLIPARHVLFLVDSCYSGLAVRSLKGLDPKTKGYLRKIMRLHVREIVTAGRKGEQSRESPDWGHGAFTYKLLEGLRTEVADINDDGVITAFELGTYLKLSVPRLADQTPQFGYLEGEGEFVFLPQVERATTLVVESSPGALVAVDGGPEQSAPLRLSRLSAGMHVVTVQAPDFEPQTVQVDLQPGEERSLQVALQRARVTLDVLSTPKGAEVTFDGTSRGKTPLQLEDTLTGEHELRLILKDHEPLERSIVVHAPPQPMTLALERSQGSIQVGSSPGDAAIYVDGKPQGEMTPCTLRLPVGECKLELCKPLYRPVTRSIQLRRGTNPPVTVSLEAQVATLSIISTPEDAAISINGEQRTEVTPAELTLPPGKYAITIEREDYESYTEEITLADRQVQRIEASLPVQTRLYVTTDPPGNEVDLGDLGVHQTPVLVRGVKPGDYEVRASMRGHRKTVQPFSVTPHLRNTLEVRLLPVSRTRMALYSLVLPGAGQYYGGRHTSGTLFLLTGLGATAGVAVGYLLYDQSVNDYNDTIASYNSAFISDEIESARAVMMDAHDDADAKFTLRQGMFITLGAVWGLNVVHTLLAGPVSAPEQLQTQAELPNWEISPRITPRDTKVMVRHRF